MNRKLAAVVLLLVTIATGGLGAQVKPTTAVSVDVFKSATCGCCSKWVDHMRKAGFTVHVTDLEEPELQKIKDRYSVPVPARSCHTARVAGYTVEGHVPPSEVQRMLKEKIKALGLAVPGMPLGSPGMEVSNMKAQPYQVLTFDKAGATQVYSVQKP